MGAVVLYLVLHKRAGVLLHSDEPIDRPTKTAKINYIISRVLIKFNFNLMFTKKKFFWSFLFSESILLFIIIIYMCKKEPTKMRLHSLKFFCFVSIIFFFRRSSSMLWRSKLFSGIMEIWIKLFCFLRCNIQYVGRTVVTVWVYTHLRQQINI